MGYSRLIDQYDRVCAIFYYIMVSRRYILLQCMCLSSKIKVRRLSLQSKVQYSIATCVRRPKVQQRNYVNEHTCAELIYSMRNRVIWIGRRVFCILTLDIYTLKYLHRAVRNILKYVDSSVIIADIIHRINHGNGLNAQLFIYFACYYWQ